MALTKYGLLNSRGRFASTRRYLALALVVVIVGGLFGALALQSGWMMLLMFVLGPILFASLFVLWLVDLYRESR